MSRSGFQKMEREYDEREERLDEARARRREFEKEMAARAEWAKAEHRAGVDALVLAGCVLAVIVGLVFA